MSLGYQKGQFWVADEKFAAYVNLPGYQALMRATTKAGFGTNIEYSYASRVYTAEILTYERFKSSGQLYIVKHNNAFHANPMAALTSAIRASGKATPLVLACCLEIECVLLFEALTAYRRREAVRAKLEATLADLAQVLGKLISYDCEDCIGMKEHGCYCRAMGALSPGGPAFVEPRSADPSDVASAQWENLQRGLYDEDDDL